MPSGINKFMRFCNSVVLTKTTTLSSREKTNNLSFCLNFSLFLTSWGITSCPRSPRVVIRVTPMKPSLVVLHGLKEVDPLAIKIAEREKIPVIATNMDLAKIKDVLNKI